MATRSADGKTVTLLCVNRSLNQDVPVQFDLGDRHVAAPSSVLEIHADNRYEQNDEVEPEQIVPVPGTIPARGPLTIILPRESVVVARVPVQ